MLSPLDSIDLAILKAIGNKPHITTREIENLIYLSRSQVLQRLQQLQEKGLVVRGNGVPGQTYYYELNPDVTPEDVERANQRRLTTLRDPVAREALEVLLFGMQAIVAQMTEMIKQIENILK